MNSNALWAPLILVISLICDGIDGSLAIITRQSSKWGALLDSVVDRLTEVFWVLGFFLVISRNLGNLTESKLKKWWPFSFLSFFLLLK